MAVISVIVIESVEQIVLGIPRSISLSTNLPATIFYTFDGTEPNLFSNIYTSTIQLPTSQPTLIVKIFATDGVDSSSVITNTYQSDISNQNARTPHSGTDARPNSTLGTLNLQPFGSPVTSTGQHFLGAATAGLNVNDPSLKQVSTGFGADGYPTGFTNGQFIGIPSKDFPVIFSETDSLGQRGPGIGTLPKSSVFLETAPPVQSDMNSALFDPRALVLIQDLTKPTDPNVPPHINRMSFTLENVERTRQGNQFFNVGLDAPPVSGSFVRQHFNPTNNTMTYYYFDSTQNRWIISTIPYTPKADQFNYASKMVLRKNNGSGAGRVFQWIPFKANYLY